MLQAAAMVEMIHFAKDHEDLQTGPDGWLIRADPARYSRDAKKARRLGNLENWTECDFAAVANEINNEFGSI